MKNRQTADIVVDWLTAKSDEDLAKAARLIIEEELLLEIGDQDEGSTTHKIEDFKVVVTGKVNRKVEDIDFWASLVEDLTEEQLPDRLNPVTIVETYKVSDKICRELRVHNPSLFSKIARGITTTKAKTHIKIERL